MVDAVLSFGDVIMVTAVIGAIVFALSYAFFFNWRKTEAGRALMYFVWSLIAVFILNTAARTFGTEYPFREWIRIFVYASVALAIWRLVWVLWRNWSRHLPVLDIPSKNRNRPRATETKE